MIKPQRTKFLTFLAVIGLGIAWHERVRLKTATVSLPGTSQSLIHNSGAPQTPYDSKAPATGDQNSSILSREPSTSLSVPTIEDAQALIDRGLTADGISALERLIQKDPTNTQAMMELAMALTLDRKDPSAARPILEHILDVNPNHRAALNELELVYRELGTTDEGIEFLRLKSQQNPQSLEIQFACGKLLADKSPGDALPWLENALAITDLKEDVLDQLASAAYRVGDLDRARKAWDEALALAERNLEKARENNLAGIDFLEDRVASAKAQRAKVGKL